MHRYLIALFVALALVVPSPAEAHRRRHPAPQMAPTDERLDALAWCESKGDRFAVSRNGTYHSYFQWSLRTWRSMGREGMPEDYSYEEQRESARALVLRAGWRSQFPSCSRRLRFA